MSVYQIPSPSVQIIVDNVQLPNQVLETELNTGSPKPPSNNVSRNNSLYPSVPRNSTSIHHSERTSSSWKAPLGWMQTQAESMGEQVEEIEKSGKCAAIVCGSGRLIKGILCIAPRTVGLTCACANAILCSTTSAMTCFSVGCTKKGREIAKGFSKTAVNNLRYCATGILSGYANIRYEIPLYIAQRFSSSDSWRKIRQLKSQFYSSTDAFFPRTDVTKNLAQTTDKSIVRWMTKSLYMRATQWLSGASEFYHNTLSAHTATKTAIDAFNAEIAQRIATDSVENSVVREV